MDIGFNFWFEVTGNYANIIEKPLLFPDFLVLCTFVTRVSDHSIIFCKRLSKQARQIQF